MPLSPSEFRFHCSAVSASRFPVRCESSALDWLSQCLCDRDAELESAPVSIPRTSASTPFVCRVLTDAKDDSPGSLDFRSLENDFLFDPGCCAAVLGFKFLRAASYHFHSSINYAHTLALGWYVELTRFRPQNVRSVTSF